MSEQIDWVGANSYFIEQVDFDFNSGWAPPHSKHWSIYILERMGIPFYFSDTVEKTNFLEGTIIRDLSDEQIEALFGESVVLDGEAARILCERGFGKYLGVDVTPWNLGRISAECFDGNSEQRCMTQPTRWRVSILPCSLFNRKILNTEKEK